MRHTFLILAWLFSDLVLFVAAYVLAYFLRVGWIFSTDFPFPPFLIAVLLASPFWLLVLLSNRTFSVLRSQRRRSNLLFLGISCIVGAALFALNYYFLYGLFFSRLLLLEALVLSIIGIVLWHLIMEKIVRRMLRSSPPSFPTLIIGVTRESRRLIAHLREKMHPLMPVAILDNGSNPAAIEGIPVAGKLQKLETAFEQYKITHVIQCSDLEQSLNLLSACRSKGITYMLLPSVLGIVERDERIEDLEGHAATVVRPRMGWKEWLFE